MRMSNSLFLFAIQDQRIDESPNERNFTVKIILSLLPMRRQISWGDPFAIAVHVIGLGLRFFDLPKRHRKSRYISRKNAGSRLGTEAGTDDPKNLCDLAGQPPGGISAHYTGKQFITGAAPGGSRQTFLINKNGRLKGNISAAGLAQNGLCPQIWFWALPTCRRGTDAIQ